MRNWRPRIATILLIVNLTVVILPLGSLVFFRIYENQLVRQTESELISQGAVLSAAYLEALRGRPVDLGHYGRKVAPLPVERINGRDYVPIIAQLDLTKDKPLPDRAHGGPPRAPADADAVAAGRNVTNIITRAQRSTLAGLNVLDFNGIVVAGRAQLGLSFAQVEEVKKALAGHYASVIRRRKTRDPLPSWSGISLSTGTRVFVAYPIIDKDRLVGVAYLSRSPRSLLQQLYLQRNKVMLAGLSIIGLTLLLALLTSATISRPMKRLVRRANKVAAGDISAMHPMKRPGTYEMEQLSKSFSDMAQALHQRSEYIREFAAHVSHEFKTPLTSIQGAAELLDEHFDSMSEGERKKFISNILQDSDRLKALVTRLLELAKADSMSPDGGETDIRTGLDTLKQHYQQVHAIGLGGHVAISPENFATVFTNLVENSLHHHAERIDISVNIEKDGLAHFVVRDNGDGISPANQQKIFTPFFTTRRADGGTGLGLRIVKSIIEAHDGTIEVRDSQSGACFVLTLPVARSHTVNS